MPSQTRAWLLHVGSGQQVAVARQQLLEFVRAVEILRVPLAREYCAGVIVWREQLVPVVELPVLLGAEPGVAGSASVGVLAYRDAPGEPLRYGAVLLMTEPREAWVNDEMACTLPREPAGWRAITLSCFSYAGRPVPILHLRGLFNEALRPVLAPGKAIRAETATAEAASPTPPPAAEDEVAVPGSWVRRGTSPLL